MYETQKVPWCDAREGLDILLNCWDELRNRPDRGRHGAKRQYCWARCTKLAEKATVEWSLGDSDLDLPKDSEVTKEWWEDPSGGNARAATGGVAEPVGVCIRRIEKATRVALATGTACGDAFRPTMHRAAVGSDDGDDRVLREWEHAVMDDEERPPPSSSGFPPREQPRSTWGTTWGRDTYLNPHGACPGPVTFEDATPGLLVRMTPTGCTPNRDRFVGAVLSKDGDRVQMRWNHHCDGGPPVSYNIKPEGSEMRDWWDGAAKPIAISKPLPGPGAYCNNDAFSDGMRQPAGGRISKSHVGKRTATVRKRDRGDGCAEAGELHPTDRPMDSLAAAAPTMARAPAALCYLTS